MAMWYYRPKEARKDDDDIDHICLSILYHVFISRVNMYGIRVKRKSRFVTALEGTADSTYGYYVSVLCVKDGGEVDMIVHKLVM